jgi:hypothetical protein
MGALRCVDGSVLSVEAVSCRDRAGQPYEITLSLARDSVPFAAVGQRCGFQLSELAERIGAARRDPAQAAAWPDPDDRFPAPDDGQGHDLDSGSGQGGQSARRKDGYLASDHEYFTLRSRERVDLPGTGELRCVLRSSAVWVGECVGVGHAHSGHDPQAGHPAVTGQSVGVPAQSGAQRMWRHPARGHGRWHLTSHRGLGGWRCWCASCPDFGRTGRILGYRSQGTGYPCRSRAGPVSGRAGRWPAGR